MILPLCVTVGTVGVSTLTFAGACATDEHIPRLPITSYTPLWCTQIDGVVALVVHRYELPPLAVSCRLSPAHTVNEPEGVIVIEDAEITCRFTELLVACAGDAQDDDDVTLQAMLSPLVRLDEANIGLLPPTFEPFTVH